MKKFKISIVIPCYRVKDTIESVLSKIPSSVDKIYCIDDACPDQSGDFIEQINTDPRVTVLRNPENLGVGGAVIHGYRVAKKEGYDIAVKVDGDDQMNLDLLPRLLKPIFEGKADYVKGNRFYNPKDLRAMPFIRLFGNAVLSFLSKASTGYWQSFDPTNGYTAIHLSLIDLLPLSKVNNRYFFETDILFRLYTIRACVKDVPMAAIYGDEESHLKISKIIFPFLMGHIKNMIKRFFYSYILRDFQLATLNFIFGLILLISGSAFGLYEWIYSINTGIPATAGTVSLAVLPILIGVQLLLSAIQNDISNVPKEAVYVSLLD